MSGLPWFKCYPRDFNDGMVGLTMEERGAYATILNMIYAKGAPIDDDPEFFRMLFCCPPKTWAKVRARLIARRKLFEVVYNSAPCLMNVRAAAVIADANQRSETLSEAGQRGGRKSQAERNKNSDLAEARLEPASSDTDTDTDKKISDANASSGVSAEPKPPAAIRRLQAPRTATRRCPASWTPSPALLDLAVREGCTPGEIERELAMMRDHEFRAPRSDWEAAARNWIRTYLKSRRPENGPAAKQSAREANLARAFAGAQDAARRRAAG